MDKLKEKGKEIKMQKAWLRNFEWTGRRGRHYGPAHIKAEDYGKILDLVPVTNSYVKKLKQEMKREYRSVKRGEKQEIRKQILRSIEED